MERRVVPAFSTAREPKRIREKMNSCGNRHRGFRRNDPESLSSSEYV
jgi:hypothetical protein